MTDAIIYEYRVALSPLEGCSRAVLQRDSIVIRLLHKPDLGEQLWLTNAQQNALYRTISKNLDDYPPDIEPHFSLYTEIDEIIHTFEKGKHVTYIVLENSMNMGPNMMGDDDIDDLEY